MSVRTPAAPLDTRPSRREERLAELDGLCGIAAAVERFALPV